MREYLDKTERKEATIIRLTSCLVLGIVVGLLTWQNRARVCKTRQRISERLFPETLDIPGLSDRPPQGERVTAWVEMVSLARSATAAGVGSGTSDQSCAARVPEHVRQRRQVPDWRVQDRPSEASRGRSS